MPVVTGRQAENSDVSPAGSVAVAVMEGAERNGDRKRDFEADVAGGVGRDLLYSEERLAFAVAGRTAESVGEEL